MRKTKTWAALVALTALAAACGGSGGDSADVDDPEVTEAAPAAATEADAAPTAAATDPVATDPPEAEDEPEPTEAPEPTEPTDPPTTTEAPTTTAAATTTTVPAIEVLSLQAVTEIPGYSLTSPFTADDASIVAVAERADEEGWSTQSIVRVDGAGAIVQEAPLGEYDSIYNVAEGGGRRFAIVGGFGGRDSTCTLREIDPASLALGWPIDLGTGNACGGRITIEEAAPTVAWVGPIDGRLLRVDLAASTVAPIDLSPVLPFGYESWDAQVFDGNIYPVAVAAYDHVTGEPVTAPDGTPLPPLLFRVDGATQAVTGPATLPGARVRVADGELVVSTDEESGMSIDPTTLALTELGELSAPTGTTYEGDGVIWSVDTFKPGALTVTQRDPDSMSIVAAGETPVSWVEDDFVSARGVPLGDELMVVVSKSIYREGADRPELMTWLFRAGSPA